MSFADVPETAPYYKAVLFLQENGIMAGDHRGNFNPSKYIRLAEAFVVLSHFLNAISNLPTSDSFERQTWFIERFPKYEWAEYYFRIFWCNGWIEHDSIKLEKKLGAPISYEDLQQIISASLDTEFPLLSSDASQHETSVTRAGMAESLYKTASILALKPQSVIKSFLKEKEYTKAWITILNHRKLVSCFETDLALICESLLKSFKNSPKIVPMQLKYMNNIWEEKQLLAVKASDISIFHYCSLETLEHLSSGSQFRAYHTAYLNDLEEGEKAKLLYKELFADTPFPQLAESDLYENSPDTGVFTVSFISNPENSLPMWSQYGNQYRGCRLQIDPSYFDGKLFPIIYKDKKFSAIVHRFIEILTAYHHELISHSQKVSIDTDPVFSFCKNILQFIRFLYKDPAFQNEQEVRLLVFADLRTALAESKPRPGEFFPRVYTEIDSFPKLFPSTPNSPLNFKEILFGPKVEKAEWIKIALIERGYDSNCIKMNSIKLQ